MNLNYDYVYDHSCIDNLTVVFIVTSTIKIAVTILLNLPLSLQLKSNCYKGYKVHVGCVCTILGGKMRRRGRGLATRPHSYAEAKKMKSLTLHTHGCLSGYLK